MPKINMKPLPQAIIDQLLANGRATMAADGADLQHAPVVKLFTPDAGATWLLTELDEDGDYAFGLCDLGMGEPELGYVSLSEIATIRGRLGLPVERDEHFSSDIPLTKWADRARVAGSISAAQAEFGR